MRRSGLQSDVLTLYRQLLKTAARKDDQTHSLRKHGKWITLCYSSVSLSLSTHTHTHTLYLSASPFLHIRLSLTLIRNLYVVSIQFREQAAKVDRKDFRAIEHYLRHGHKQKKLMEMPGFRFARTNL